MHPYRNIYILKQAEVKNSYFDIRNDMDRLYCATYIVNLAEAVATTGDDNTSLLCWFCMACPIFPTAAGTHWRLPLFLN